MPTVSESPTRFLRLPQVKQRTGLSRSSVYAKVSLRKFPAPINLGTRAVAWIESEIEEWINDRVKASRSSMNTSNAPR
jgi:prophage regulatory protein